MSNHDALDHTRKTVEELARAARNTRGFGERPSFLCLEIRDDGKVTLHHECLGGTVEIENDERLLYQIRLVLTQYCSSPVNAGYPAREEEKFTKISLLDDSMHLGCSTNQHRIENEFKDMLDRDLAAMARVFEKILGGERVDKGDAAWRFQLLPRVPALLVYYEAEGDNDCPAEIVPSSLTIFFEKNSLLYLSREGCEALEDILLAVVKRLHASGC